MARKSLLAAGEFLGPADVPDLQTRIIKNDAVRSGRVPAASVSASVDGVDSADSDRGGNGAQTTVPSENTPYNKSYDDMTNRSYDESYDDMTEKSYKNTTGQTLSDPAGLSSTQQSILAALKQGGKTEPALKTVTIKLSPSLDIKVEEHMRDTGRKKQDIVRDGLHLYFETVEQAQRAAGGD